MVRDSERLVKTSFGVHFFIPILHQQEISLEAIQSGLGKILTSALSELNFRVDGS